MGTGVAFAGASSPIAGTSTITGSRKRSCRRIVPSPVRDVHVAEVGVIAPTSATRTGQNFANAPESRKLVEPPVKQVPGTVGSSTTSTDPATPPVNPSAPNREPKRLVVCPLLDVPLPDTRPHEPVIVPV